MIELCSICVILYQLSLKQHCMLCNIVHSITLFSIPLILYKLRCCQLVVIVITLTFYVAHNISKDCEAIKTENVISAAFNRVVW